MTIEEAKTKVRDKTLIHMGEDMAKEIIEALSIDYTLTAEEEDNGIGREKLFNIWMDQILGI